MEWNYFHSNKPVPIVNCNNRDAIWLRFHAGLKLAIFTNLLASYHLITWRLSYKALIKHKGTG